MFAALVVRLIRFYQRRLSPHKGFNCAHRVLAGKASCSTYTRRAVSRHGVLTGFLLMQRRLQDCRATYMSAIANAQQDQDEDDNKRKQPGSGKPSRGAPDKTKKKSDPWYSYCDLPLSGSCSPCRGSRPSKDDGLDCGPDLDCDPC